MNKNYTRYFSIIIFFLMLYPVFGQTGKLHYSIIDGEYDLRRINEDGTSDERVYLPPVTEQIQAITIDNIDNKLFYVGYDGTLGNQLYKSELNGLNKSVFISGKKISSLIYFNGKIYYSTVSGDYDVRRVNTNGTSDELVYMPPLTEQVECLTVDPVNNKLYLAALDATNGNKLYKSDLNGTNKTPFISGHKISSLAYCGGKIYYSKTSGDYDVRRINCDGTSDELVYMPPITEQVNCLTIDGVNNKLYLAALDATNGNKLYKSNLNGSNMTTLISNKKISALANFNDPALPVELKSITISANNNKVTLKWQTATEVNNYGFEIERATDTTAKWESVGFVQGCGNSNSPKDYSFDDKPNGGIEFKYRLKQIDSDGKYEYSSVVEVKLAVPADFSVKQNFPNPFNPATNIEFKIPSDNNVQLKVFNILGMEVATLLNGFKQAGTHKVEFDAGNLSSGIYFYKVVCGNYSEIKKMILLR